MSKQDNKLAVWVLATLTSGIGLIYTLIMYHNIFFAVIGMSALFLICAFILTQSIISFATMRNKSLNVQIKNSVDGIANQLEAMNGVQTQIGKATYLYTRKAAQSVATLENNYSESQEALYKNLISLSHAHNKAAKLMIKYDQSNTTKVISTIKDLRNQLSDTMVQGFDQLQPDNTEVVDTLGQIVEYLKSQSGTMDQEMGIQLNSIARELQNVSNSIQHIQFAANVQPAASIPNPAAFEAVSGTPVQPEETVLPEQNIIEPNGEEAVAPSHEDITEAADAAETESNGATTPGAEENETEENKAEAAGAESLETIMAEMETVQEESIDIADMEESPAAETTVSETEHAEAFTPTFTVVGKSNESDTSEEPVAEAQPEESAEEPAAPQIKTIGDLGDDPNKQLSPDEIAALFAAAEPAPKKEPKAETPPEPVAASPVSNDPNKQLSPDEIAALFAAAEPAPKKEPVTVPPISDDPNKQLTPDEIAALFAASSS